MTRTWFIDGNLINSKLKDVVNKWKLVDSLESSLNITDTALSWLKSYLTNRHQFIHINNCTSSTASLSRGFPLGSVLGPLLFIYAPPWQNHPSTQPSATSLTCSTTTPPPAAFTHQKPTFCLSPHKSSTGPVTEHSPSLPRPSGTHSHNKSETVLTSPPSKQRFIVQLFSLI